MASAAEQEFICALKKSAKDRNEEDFNVIFGFLHGLESLSNIRKVALHNLCKHVHYEFHHGNSLLYCRGEPIHSWFILLSGSVFIEGTMYLPRNGFGKRTAGCMHRPNECLVLEPSEMIVIDYPDAHTMNNKDNIFEQRMLSSRDRKNSHDVETSRRGHARYSSDGSICVDEIPQELQNVHSMLQRSQVYLQNESNFKRDSHASDTSSAYSGSDLMQSSVDEQDIELGGLGESVYDSDDEDTYAQAESISSQDAVRDSLEKEPNARTEDDIEILLEFMQHFPAFANMTSSTRRALCAVMVYAFVEKEDTIVMNHQEELDSWSVILNGHVKIEKSNDTIVYLQTGDSFGITPTMEKLYHDGRMRTMVDDCQFVCIAQSDYYAILHQGEENTQHHEEAGKVVLVTEHRILDAGNRKGQIVIRGTAERLMTHLIEEHASVDPTYVEDFLLTYRTFLTSPMTVAENLIQWFDDAKIRDRVTRVVLLWVNNHFNDFETNSNLSEFLEKFEHLLERFKMGGQLRLLNIACAAKASFRVVTLNRATRDEILNFSVLGGLERCCGIFISKVEKSSKAHDAGLKRGDQIIDVNNYNFENIAHNRALELLRGATHLSITVKSNLLGFREMLMNSEMLIPSNHSQGMKQRYSAPDIESNDVSLSNSIKYPNEKEKQKGFLSAGHRSKIRKALTKFIFQSVPRSGNSDPQLNQIDKNTSSLSRSESTSSAHSPMRTHLSASNPDLSTIGNYVDDRNDYPEHVLCIYKIDQLCKYFLVHRETSAREVVMLALREFGINEPSNHYSLCEVTVESEGLIKQKKLSDLMTNLPDRMTLNSRYYLKSNMSTEPLVPDELAPELLKESQVTFLQLNPAEVAAQLTLRDFQKFHQIEPTEYIDDIFGLSSQFGTPYLQKFSEIINHEMFWVVTEVCYEPNIVKRMKIIKNFIKIARHCKECKNYNSMFALVSGLGHGSVKRLKNTWEKLPAKYFKLFESLQDMMDPSRNMSKYRNLINSEMIQPPLIPFFPVVKKDLTFIHLGNDSVVEELINMEKLRMIAKEIRHVCNMASAQYDLASMLIGGGNCQSVFSAFSSDNSDAVATMRRRRRISTLPNPKRMFDEAQMIRRVKTYLLRLKAIEDEVRLDEMSQVCEHGSSAIYKRIDLSPSSKTTNNKLNLNVNAAPKFGAESPTAVHKLMGLTEKVRPTNSKPPTSPSSTGHRKLSSPHHGNRLPPAAVHLSSESSSIYGLSELSFRKSKTSYSFESTSPTSSIGSNSHQQETDSGHYSMVSSNFDSHSSSSMNSAYSPTSSTYKCPNASMMISSGQFLLAPSVPVNGTSHTSSQYAHDNYSRPPLPSYDAIMQKNSSGYSNYIESHYGQMRNNLYRPSQQHVSYYNRPNNLNCPQAYDELCSEQLTDDDIKESEQISAV